MNTLKNMLTQQIKLSELKAFVKAALAENRTGSSYVAYEFTTLYNWINQYLGEDFLLSMDIQSPFFLMKAFLDGDLSAKDIDDQLRLGNAEMKEPFGKLFSELSVWQKVKDELELPDVPSSIEKDVVQYDDSKKDIGSIPDMSDVESGAIREVETPEEKNKRIIDKWIAELGARGAAKKIIDGYISRTLGGMTSEDLTDSATFADGLDEIEDLLTNQDYKSAIIIAKETVMNMLEDEGFGSALYENKEKNKNTKMNTQKIKLSELKSLVKEILAEIKEGNNTDTFDSMKNHIEETEVTTEEVAEVENKEVEMEEGNHTTAFASMRNHIEETEEVEVTNEETEICEECDEMEESTEPKEDEVMESEMAMRAGAEGKVYEESEDKDDEDDEKLNEAINRFKKIISY